MSDLRRERHVTQGAFMAAQLCKADRGELAVQRGKLDLVCSLLISAGILDQGVGGEFSVSRYDTKQSAVADQAVKRVALEEKIKCVESEAADQDAKRVALERQIKRVESAAREAREDGQRATTVAVEASKAAEKVAGQCLEVDAKCTEAGARSSVLEDGMDEGRRRTEANSARIFELAAEMERLEQVAESNRESLELVAMPLTSREEKTSCCALEMAADITPREERREVPPSKGLDATRALEEAPREGRRTLGLTPKAEGGDSEGYGGVVANALVGGSKTDRGPRRPGVLDAPGPQGHPEVDTRKHTTTSTPRRRATHTGRRVLSGNLSVQGVDPVRPKVNRPRAEQATPNSWARASWPSLANEKGHFVRPESCLLGKADNEPDESLLQECSMPILALSPAHDEQPRQPTGSEAELGCANLSDDPGIDCRDTVIDLPPRGCHAGGGGGGGGGSNKSRTYPHARDPTSSASVAPTHHQPRNINSQHPEAQDLITTTVNEAGALLEALASGRRQFSGEREGLIGELEPRHVTTENNNSGGSEKVCGTVIGSDGRSTDLNTERADSRGGRLAYLEGAPKLWRPRDTWDLEVASASGSSSSGELQ